MTPTRIGDWIEDWIEDDGELVGFLAPTGDRFIPMTVFGAALAEPSDRVGAEDALDASGLSYLADRWRLRVDEQTQTEVEIVEASPERVVVQNVDFGSGLGHGHRFALIAPVDNRLTRKLNNPRDP